MTKEEFLTQCGDRIVMHHLHNTVIMPSDLWDEWEADNKATEMKAEMLLADQFFDLHLQESR